jgi:hypothetical protein
MDLGRSQNFQKIFAGAVPSDTAQKNYIKSFHLILQKCFRSFNINTFSTLKTLEYSLTLKNSQKNFAVFINFKHFYYKINKKNAKPDATFNGNIRK